MCAGGKNSLIFFIINESGTFHERSIWDTMREYLSRCIAQFLVTRLFLSTLFSLLFPFCRLCPFFDLSLFCFFLHVDVFFSCSFLLEQLDLRVLTFVRFRQSPFVFVFPRGWLEAAASLNVVWAGLGEWWMIEYDI